MNTRISIAAAIVVDGEMYAFPMEQVEEIIRMPATVRVPLGPPPTIGFPTGDRLRLDTHSQCRPMSQTNP